MPNRIRKKEYIYEYYYLTIGIKTIIIASKAVTCRVPLHSFLRNSRKHLVLLNMLLISQFLFFLAIQFHPYNLGETIGNPTDSLDLENVLPLSA